MTTLQDPDLSISNLLPLRALVVTLQFTQASNPQFFHQAPLTAFLRFLAGSPEDFDLYIRIDTPETGRIRYQQGDCYRFMIVALQGGNAILQTLIHKLQGLPRTAPKQAHELPFRNNWKLLELQDGFSEMSIHSFEQLSCYTENQLQEEIALWNGQTNIHCSWLSPARMLKEKQQRINLKGEERYIRDAKDIDGNLLFSRIYHSLADLLRRRGEKTPAHSHTNNIIISDAHLFWMDSHYTNSQNKTQQMGGITGRISLQLPENLSPAWWKLLLIGQYSGVGQRTAFGWGRYQLQTDQEHFSYRRVLPASSMIMLAQEEENLDKAWRHVMAGHDELHLYGNNEGSLDGSLDDEDNYVDNYVDNYEDTDEDNDEDQQATRAPIQRLQKDLDKLLFNKYKVPALRGYLVPKKDGGVRPLAVPPIYDRVLQRCITQVLTPALEQLMYRHSHGYRPGRSRITASYEIQAAWRAGYRWVYESDIKNFFDSVNLNHLKDRLNAIYHGDPLVDRIIDWMQASVIFQGQKIERKNGLPQGSPLSPLMANLMLDDFDSDMKTAGFHLIRFADDFIVLCKDPQEAQKAKQLAIESLQEHGLQLHPDKSQITSLDEGFKYLGYLFINDMALDMSASPKTKMLEKAKPPTGSWLANLAEQEPQRLDKQQSLSQLIEKVAQKQPIKIAERDTTGTLLTVTGDHSVLSTLNKQVQVHRKDKLLYRLPWKSLQAIILFGNHQITTQAMHAALQNDVPIHLANGLGRYKGVITHNRNNQHQRLWLQQTICFEDDEKALYCAKEIVASRLRHIKEHLRQRHQSHNIPVITNALRKINKAENLQSLRGYEGSASKEYYQRISLILPTEFEFSGRNRRPPKDPFNVLLSLGYTTLYSMTESLLHTAGLLPWQGFYHQPRGKHAALASDMMEPFRFLIERTAISLIKRTEIKPDDFSYSVTGACIISNQARRKYLALLLQRWDTKITAKGQEEPQTWIKHLQQQNQSLKDFILKGKAFKPFRLR